MAYVICYFTSLISVFNKSQLMDNCAGIKKGFNAINKKQNKLKNGKIWFILAVSIHIKYTYCLGYGIFEFAIDGISS